MALYLTACFLFQDQSSGMLQIFLASLFFSFCASGLHHSFFLLTISWFPTPVLCHMEVLTSRTCRGSFSKASSPANPTGEQKRSLFVSDSTVLEKFGNCLEDSTARTSRLRIRIIINKPSHNDPLRKFPQSSTQESVPDCEFYCHKSISLV